MTRVVVVGATGFVGGAVASALEDEGHDVVRLRAPRLAPAGALPSPEQIASMAEVSQVSSQIAGARAVVNAAGNPDASSTDTPALLAANSLLPAVLAAAVARHPHARFVQVSSAVVQGRQGVLDAGPAHPGFSPYSRSKAHGERLAVEMAPDQTVVYRPPSVHAADRRVTRLISRIAASPLAAVAAPGTQPSPQALLPNVASAIAFLATTDRVTPRIVMHPSEGLTTARTMELLGGRRPRRIPTTTATVIIVALRLGGRCLPRIAAHARRVELLWCGQDQARSWLTDAGWEPTAGHDAWAELGRRVRSERRSTKTHKEQPR